ncbi:hypothetical protein FQR65_LT07410 [Abscondita terminalis]|nr:hypothetical protein FQR65_LT07410 [Abscondita terminalis]
MQDAFRPKYKGTWHCFHTLLVKDGLRGVYRGISSPLVGVAAINALVFGIYGNAQRCSSDPTSLMSHFVAGSIAGLGQTVICSPMELVKTRSQLSSTGMGPLECFKKIYKSEGVKGLFRGVTITATREVPAFSSYFVTYEILTRSNDNRETSTATMLFAGGMAGCVSWAIVYPVDVIKSRLQMDGINGVQKYKGATDCLRKGLASEGVSFLTRGLTPTLVRAFPTNAACFTAVTWCMRLLSGDIASSDYHNPEKGAWTIENAVSTLTHTCEQTSELKLNLPNVEHIQAETSDQQSSTYNLTRLFANDGTDVGEVSSEIAYFSPRIESNESTSSIEVTSIDSCCEYDDDDRISSDEKLKSRKVYTSPLLAVRSAAHHDCIKSEHNNIFVTLVNSQGSISNPDWINVCRICHGGESNGDLLSPCQCRGSIALTHMECLERWLKESATSHCELCRYHYTLLRQPKYGLLKSILVFMSHPGDRLWEVMFDLLGFIVYTSATIVSTYTLSLLCESISKNNTTTRFVSSQIVGFTSILGIAVIDFTYTSWLLTNLEKHTIAWQAWYRANCDVKVILSNNKQFLKSSREESLLTEQD